MPHYNTTNLTGKALTKKVWSEKSQTYIIKAFFEASPQAWYTPSQVWIELFDIKKVPITSIRRSMSDLTKEGILEKTDQKQTGYFGDLEHLWTLKNKPEVQLKLF